VLTEMKHTLLLLREIRDEQRLMRARMTFEFSEIQDRLRRIEERLDARVERLEARDESH
jgi:hypothetical protein